jgi:hypothetical protein
LVGVAVNVTAAPKQMLVPALELMVTDGVKVGLTIIVATGWDVLEHPLAVAIALIVPEICKELVLVVLNEFILPLPLNARLIALLLLVQVKVAPVTPLEKVIGVVGCAGHHVCVKGLADTLGIGFTL